MNLCFESNVEIDSSEIERVGAEDAEKVKLRRMYFHAKPGFR